MIGTKRFQNAKTLGTQGSWCLKTFSKNDRQEPSRRLLSRPSGTLSSIRNGGEGWGEEALIGEAIGYHLERI